MNVLTKLLLLQRNSMSADDAQQNIPSGHVAKMRQAVDELNRAKRVKTAIGVAIVPVSWSRDFQIV